MCSDGATWMDLEIIILSEENHEEKNKHCMILLICGISSMAQMNLIKKHSQT